MRELAPDPNALFIPAGLLQGLGVTLAPGVSGYAVETAGVLYIPLIVADHEGAGDVGRYLDSLPADRPVRVPCVISSRLAGMLARRGFTARWEFNAELGEAVEVWCRP